MSILETAEAQVLKVREYLAENTGSVLTWKLVVAGIILYLLKSIVTIIYRLTFHPLARFPGPFLCRIGYFQQTYYEAILNGKFLERLPDYHRKYGESTCIGREEWISNVPM